MIFVNCMLFYFQSLPSMHLNDCDVISQSVDVRRGTLYKKPGPPTPSKQGGRLSVGGTSSGRLSFGSTSSGPSEIHKNRDVLKESNGKSTKKTTPTGKFRSMFSTGSRKDEVIGLVLFFIEKKKTCVLSSIV